MKTPQQPPGAWPEWYQAILKERHGEAIRPRRTKSKFIAEVTGAATSDPFHWATGPRRFELIDLELRLNEL